MASVLQEDDKEGSDGLLRQALEHAREALRLIDAVSPASILGARCQHLIDELETEIASR